jgi:hypothetical protein
MRFLKSGRTNFRDYRTNGSRRWRPRLESLESRDVPSVLAVTSTGDSGAGTLRDAISRAATGDQSSAPLSIK